VIEKSLYPDHAAHSMYTASLFTDVVLASLSDLPFAVSCVRFFCSLPRILLWSRTRRCLFSFFSPVLWRQSSVRRPCGHGQCTGEENKLIITCPSVISQ